MAIIEGNAPGGTIGLRADMDALPIEEASGVAHTSLVPGRCMPAGMTGM